EALKAQLESALTRIRELESQGSETVEERNDRIAERTDLESSVAPISEADVTLRRLVQRIAMILQAEKIAIMFYDREAGELKGIPPSYGIEEDLLAMFKVRATHGISGQVFREGEAAIFHDAMGDPRTQRDPFGIIHVHNGITVPLVIEKRDDENRVV